MTTKTVTLAVALSAAGLLTACGDEAVISAPTPQVPAIAGIYSAFRPWVHQVYRVSDGFITSFSCSGSITLAQQPSGTGIATVTGFAVVGAPCPPLSFDLAGTVTADGAVRFISGGPKPPEGPCPGGANVEYTGAVTGRTLSARGVTTVQCPEYGEHRFTYIFTASR
jgi:hypothetical protein